MINLLIVVPYQEMKKTVNFIMDEYYKDDDIFYDVLVRSVEEIFETDLKINISKFDAILARGFSALHLSKCFSRIPVINFTISSYDISSAIRECTHLYHPKKIGICGLYGTLTDNAEISKLFGCSVQMYPANDYRKLQVTFERAVADGCDAIIGGTSVTKISESFGINSVRVKTGATTIIQAVREAVNIVTLLKKEKAETKLYKSVFNLYENGVLFVDSFGKICTANAAAKIALGRSNLNNLSLKQASPVLYPFFRDSLNLSETAKGTVNLLNSLPYTVTCAPATIDSNIHGVFITIINSPSESRKLPFVQHHPFCIASCTFDDIVYSSSVTDHFIRNTKKLSLLPGNVFISGPIGSGKSILAQCIHNESSRKHQSFVTADCTLLDSVILAGNLLDTTDDDLYYIKNGKSLIEKAAGGTLFLDNIHELLPDVQKSLLGFLRKNQYVKETESSEYIDIRIISASRFSPEFLINNRSFNAELLSLLESVRINVPDLKERGSDDAVCLLRHFVKHYSIMNKGIEYSLDEKTGDFFTDIDLPGNVRDIINIAQMAVAESEDTTITGSLISEIAVQFVRNSDVNLQMQQTADAFNEKKQIQTALSSCNGNKTKAAKMLGIDRTTLWRKINKYRI